MKLHEKHLVRYFGGLGTLVLVYAPIRLLESRPAIFMIVVGSLIAYGLGWLLDREYK